jgi:hypothetical protein
VIARSSYVSSRPPWRFQNIAEKVAVGTPSHARGSPRSDAPPQAAESHGDEPEAAGVLALDDQIDIAGLLGRLSLGKEPNHPIRHPPPGPSVARAPSRMTVGRIRANPPGSGSARRARRSAARLWGPRRRPPAAESRKVNPRAGHSGGYPAWKLRAPGGSSRKLALAVHQSEIAGPTCLAANRLPRPALQTSQLCSLGALASPPARGISQVCSYRRVALPQPPLASHIGPIWLSQTPTQVWGSLLLT